MPDHASAPALSLVILAAGASRRLGCCKALVPLSVGPESSPLARLLKAGKALDPKRLAIVAGKDQAAIEAFRLQRAADAQLVRNPAWTAGRTGSVRVAHLALLGHDLCLAPVDVPLVPASTFQALAQAWRAAGSPASGWLAPVTRLEGQLLHGHPIILGRELVARLDASWDARPLRELRGLAAPLWDLELADESILDDLDQPADLERLRARLARK